MADLRISRLSDHRSKRRSRAQDRYRPVVRRLEFGLAAGGTVWDEACAGRQRHGLRPIPKSSVIPMPVLVDIPTR